MGKPRKEKRIESKVKGVRYNSQSKMRHKKAGNQERERETTEEIENFSKIPRIPLGSAPEFWTFARKGTCHRQL